MDKAWLSYGVFKKWVSRLFHHHNKKISLVKQVEGRNEHTDAIAINEFRNQVYAEFKRRLLTSILLVWHKVRIHEDRETNLQNLVAIYSLLEEVLEISSVERKDFFDKMSDLIVRASDEYYSLKQREWNTDDCGSYFNWLDNFSRDEEEILTLISQCSSELRNIAQTVRSKFYSTLLADYKNTLTQSQFGLQFMIHNRNYESLKKIKRLYTLYRDDFVTIYEKYKSVVAAAINDRFDEYVKLINDEQDEKVQKRLKVVRFCLKQGPQLVNTLIELFTEQDTICTECFDNNPNFRFLLNKAFEEEINKDGMPFSLPFMLAQVTNDTLDAAIKSDNTDASMRQLQNVITLMSCLEEKDRYLYYLSLLLSKRLLDADLDSLNSMEWEKQLIHVIKSKLGAEFSKNLEAMIIDVEACYEKKAETKEYFQKHAGNQLVRDFHVNVLSNCEWMLPTSVEVSPPTNVQVIQKLFEDFFTADQSNLNKRLEWNYTLGSMEVKFNQQGKEYGLICKPYQYFVMQLFQNRDVLTLAEIANSLKVKEPLTLESVMDSLTAKPSLLVRVDEGNLQESSQFAINKDFKSKTKKVTIREARLEDRFKGKNQVDNERVLAIQGCIVRVLKSNKIMEYSEVVRMVEKLMLKFNPTSKAIRKEIDELIKREFIERDPENFNRLRYLA